MYLTGMLMNFSHQKTLAQLSFNSHSPHSTPLHRTHRTPENLPRSYPNVDTKPGEYTSTPKDPMGLGLWPPTPPNSVSRNGIRPATIHETDFTYSLPDSFASLEAWEPTTTAISNLSGYSTSGFDAQAITAPATSSYSNPVVSEY
jgi:hypothetical protein